MRRILASTMMLASALFVAGCASSSNNNQDNGLLNGQYVFQEQVYTYIAPGDTAPARVAARGRQALRPLTQVATLPRREQRLQAMLANRTRARHTLPAAFKNALPRMGDENSTVSWGAAVGSLTFDGNGNVTTGELDFNEPTGGGYYSEPVNGSYSVDGNRVGTISLASTNGDGFTYDYQITLEGSGQATGAQLLEGIADGFGDFEIGTGKMVQQTASQSQSTLNGNYVFGVQGQTCYACSQSTQGDLFAAGVLAADGAGNFGATGQAAISTGFQSDSAVVVSGTYSAPDANGRSTATFATTGYTNGALPSGYVIYAAGASTAFIMSTDQSGDGTPAGYLAGEMDAQSGTFTNASFTGNFVVGETTEDLANEQPNESDSSSDAFIAVLTASGGTLSGTGDTDRAGTVTNTVPFNYGAYVVAANGRVTLTGTSPTGANAPVFYLSGTGLGYGVDQLQGNSFLQEPGLLYLFQQTGSSFSNSSLNGNYAVGTLPTAISLVGLNAGSAVGPGLLNGELTADGNGNLTNTNTDSAEAYINGAGGNGDFTGTYMIGANGRGTIVGSTTDGNSLFVNTVFYMANPGLALAMDNDPGNTAPELNIFQQ